MILRTQLCPYARIAALIFLAIWFIPLSRRQSTTKVDIDPHPEPKIPKFSPGIPKPPGSKYTKTVVVARLELEDVSWLDNLNADINKAVYVVDNPVLSPGYKIPINKGHEAMVYLTYIIDHYYNLSDTTIFVHAHQKTWHNNDLLDSNMLKTIEHMSDAHIARVGYFNTRCHHEPGCPDWLHLDRPEGEYDSPRKMEEETFSIEVWRELHPGIAAPRAISQPCCAQFAVSSTRIQANPLSEYIRYRDWVIHTGLEDTYSGRIMEYSWQYLFAGVSELCPEINYCYCEGYGICMGGTTQLQQWLDLREERDRKSAAADEIEGDLPRESEARDLRDRVSEIELLLEESKMAAFARGQDPKARAAEGDRTWMEGDGF